MISMSDDFALIIMQPDMYSITNQLIDWLIE